MCDLLSGWIDLDTDAIYTVDLRSHSDTRRHYGWKAQDLERKREWEWLADDAGESLAVRVNPDDPPETAWFARATILTRWPTRPQAIAGCMALIPLPCASLDLSGATLPAGIVIPDGCRAIR